MLGNNVKIHFAGSDGEENFYAALNAADTRYRLYSCYKYIVSKKPDDNFKLPEGHVIVDQCHTAKHVIQDSGLFTLMFGAGKGQKQTISTLTEWQDKLMAFVKQNHITASIVEIDCQKVLGPEEAWYFRQRMKDMMPEIDIHLLGCTDFKIIRENNFCTSADSTSWLSGVKYGYIDDGYRKEHIRNFKRSLFNEREQQVKAMLESRGVEIKQKTLEYTTNASLCATICKDLYARTCGPQD